MMIDMTRRPVVVVAATLVLAALSCGVLVTGAAARGRAAAPGRQAAASHTISVQGHGEVSVAPDQATLSVGVQSRADTAQAALADAATKMNAVIAAVEAQGVPADHIQTSDLSLYRDGQLGQDVASHTVTVRLDDVNKTGDVLDAAVSAGANTSWGVSFGLKDASGPQAQALQAAVADARKHADKMAAALGVSISGVTSAEQTTYSYRPLPAGAAAAPAAPGAPTPIQAGQLTVTADVTVVYTFG